MGVMTPKPVELTELTAGEVGFFVATIKNVADTKVGDTITSVENPCAEPLPGFEDIKSMVFAGLYTVDSHEHAHAPRRARKTPPQRRQSFSFEPESSVALGFGFRCGFLGLLHLEIIQERLEREYDLDLITTAPGVRYKITLTDGSCTLKSTIPPAGPTPPRSNPSKSPSSSPRSSPTKSTSATSSSSSKTNAAASRTSSTSPRPESCSPTSSRSTKSSSTSTTASKSVSRGYASLDYNLAGTWISPMVKMDILIGGDPVDALSIIVHRDFAYDRGKALVSKMRELIPRQMFEVAIQAAIGSKIIARETVTAIRKNVIAKVLRRRHQPQAQTPRKAEGRQEAHEANRQGRHPAGGLPRRPQGRRGVTLSIFAARRSRTKSLENKFPVSTAPSAQFCEVVANL